MLWETFVSLDCIMFLDSIYLPLDAGSDVMSKVPIVLFGYARKECNMITESGLISNYNLRS